MLSPQGADYSRALLKFKYGKQMKENNSFEAFAVAGAGLYGEVDKEDIETRLKWVENNMQRFIDCAKEPLTNTDWSKADKPFSFLAWCFELKILLIQIMTQVLLQHYQYNLIVLTQDYNITQQ